MNDSKTKTSPKSSWTLSGEAWDGFIRWIDEGVDSDGRSYLEMRHRLVCYFDRKNCRDPDALADDTLDRVARRLHEEGTIISETPAKYCYTVARFVFLESSRSKESNSDSVEEMSGADELRAPEIGPEGEREKKEIRLACLDKCSAELEADNRELIFEYYAGKERVKIENRRSLAERFGISGNALSIRAFRIREKLEACVRLCCGEK